MTTIQISRNSEWSNRFRDIELYLDGRKLGDIADGETKTFTVTPGQHQLHAEIDWCGSQKISFTISECDTLPFELSGFKYGKYLAPISTVLIVAYLIMYFAFEASIIFLAVPEGILFLYMLYYLSFGRSKYLHLQQLPAKKPEAVSIY